MGSKDFSRRAALLGAAGLAALGGGPAMGAASGQRLLQLYRAGDRIGEKSVSVSRDGSTVDVAIDIDVAAKVLGVTAYRYALQSRERWRGGELASLQATTSNNGADFRVSAEGGPNGVRVEGTGYTGLIAGCARVRKSLTN